MGAADAAGTDRERCGRPTRRADALDQRRGGDDVDDRVPGADLVKRHILCGDAVDASLGLGEGREDRDCAPCDPRLKPRAFKHGADVAKRAVMGVASRRRDQKAGPRQRSVVERRRAGSDPVGQVERGERGVDRARLRGPRVEQRRREHVSGDAADWFEMDMHGRIIAESATRRLPSASLRRLMPGDRGGVVWQSRNACSGGRGI